MTAITPAYRIPRLRLREIEDAVIGVSSWLAPMGALLPAAWITAERLIVYLAIPGPAACVMAGAVELMGLAIVATRTALIDRNRPDLTRRMDWAFGGYLTVIVTVNGVLAIAAMGGWLPLGKVIAELVLALMSLPASALVGVRRQLAAMETAEIVAIETESAKQAAADTLTLELRRMELDARAVENDKRRAERAEKRSAKAPKPKPAEVVTEPTRTKKQVAMEFISARFSTSGAVPKLTEIMAAAGIGQSSASDFRAEWKINHPANQPALVGYQVVK